MRNSFVIERRPENALDYEIIDDYPNSDAATNAYIALKREPNMDYRIIHVISESLCYREATEEIIVG